MTSIELKSVTKKFGHQPALKDVNANIDSGEKIAILGPSGSGKSTLLRIIAGLELATSGTIYLNGLEATDIQPHQRSIGMLFQRDSLYPHLSVEENIHFAKPKDSKAQQWMEHFEELVSWMELSPLLKRMPQQLSGGEQQRVALARALVRRPKILLLDEPLSHLDRRLSRLVQNLILAAQRRYAITMLYVTHDLDDALSFADRVIVLHQGELIEVDSPAKLTESVLPFVREFLDLDRQRQVVGECRLDNGQVSVNIPSISFEFSAESTKLTLDPFGLKAAKEQSAQGRVECRVRLLNWHAYTSDRNPATSVPDR